jgi:beta-glucanase (GH16 family)
MRNLIAAGMLASLALTLPQPVAATTPVSAATPVKKLLWSQEFNEPAGTPPNPKFFKYDLGGGGWGNKEMQWYNEESVQTNGSGQLVISATKIPPTQNGDLPYNCFGDCQYFSGRINTQGKVRFKYGRLEARIQMPSGTGVWPAFWLLGSNIVAKSWPTSGEIDVVELRGREPDKVIATAHGPGYSGANGKSNIIDSPTSLSAGFHTYAIEWAANKISWFLDGKLFHSITPATVKPNTYVFNQDFFMILNVAMGGEFDGGALDTSIDKAEMKVDYIRYYSVNGVGKVTTK